MLLARKNKFALGEIKIKEELCAEDGAVLLRINLKCPDIECKKGDSLFVFARDFYKKLISAFDEYAKTELFKAALAAYTRAPQEFMPYSALMTYNVTYFDERFLSVVTDITVYEGTNDARTDRKTQVWEREYGTKCRISYFLSNSELDEIKKSLTRKQKRNADFDLFALTEKGIEIYLPSGVIEKIIDKF